MVRSHNGLAFAPGGKTAEEPELPMSREANQGGLRIKTVAKSTSFG